MNKKSRIYEEFKNSFLGSVSDNIDVGDIKTHFKSSITARRRYERIKSLNELIEVLENQLVIFPERGVIQAYKTIANNLSPPRRDLLTSVENTQKHLVQPNPLPPPARSQPHTRHLPTVNDRVINKIADTF